MKNNGLPFKYTLSNAQSTNIVMSGYNGTGGSCQSGIWKTLPNQDLRNLEPDKQGSSGWIWQYVFSMFFTQQ